MNTNEYYYLDSENKPHGPHTLEELQQMLEAGTLPTNTPVSYLGAVSWQPLSAVCAGLPDIPPSTAGGLNPAMAAEREQYSDSMGLFNVYTFVVFKNYLNFRGRATRREYWGFIFVNFLISCVATIGGAFIMPFGANIYSLLVALPSIAVMFRRLHDVGRSGWWYCWSIVSLIPYFIVIGCFFWGLHSIAQSIDETNLTQEEYSDIFTEQVSAMVTDNLIWLGLSITPGLIVSIIILIFTLKDSQKGTNKYGPSYKYPDTAP